MNTAAFRAEVREQLEHIGQTDILVGIPSFNNARTIGHVVRAVQAGLAKYFPDKKAVIVNSDGGSSDGTMDVVRNTSIDDFNAILLHHRVEPVSKIAFPFSGIPGKGSAFRTFFEIADELGAKACAVVDSDLNGKLDEHPADPELEPRDLSHPGHFRDAQDGRGRRQQVILSAGMLPSNVPVRNLASRGASRAAAPPITLKCILLLPTRAYRYNQ